MSKLLRLYDNYFLKFGIAFLLIFTALYPKLPSIHIIRTWVYIRLEDFIILAIAAAWAIQLFRKKSSLPSPLAWPIFAYWAIGLISLIFSILFISPQLLNFFPHIAVLSFLRRIEYMILFLIAFSTIKNIKDLRDYFIILCLTLTGVIIYGFGQHFYISLWSKLPSFFSKFPFCFPSFQTGNEEFAKGIPLCLPYGARITSTFGGHYDLAAYLVLVTPILLSVALSLKKNIFKITTFILFIGGVILLIFTASRISFASYIIAVVSSLIFYRKKLFILPVLILSIILLMIFSEATAKRFLSTIRISSIITNSQGQLVGEALPQDLKNKLSEGDRIFQAPPPAQNLPSGSGFIGLPEKTTPVATSVAFMKKTLTPQEARKLKLASGSLEISTVSGSFLIRQALVYDISFTTRFQSEWPNAINAFMRNPLLGSGYSSITLATDGDYFRALGETGILGLISFLLIFLFLGITMKHLVHHVESPLGRGMIYGIAGGVVGLAINALLIDVFEASKVAENLWMILGIGTGTLYLYKNKPVPYIKYIKKVFTSNFFIFIYLLILLLTVFSGSIHNFFVADDFTWLHWAAQSSMSDIPKYFTDSKNFFYRPLDKTIIFFLYTLFSFQPQGYHVFTYLLHFIATLGVFFLASMLIKNKLIAFMAALLFLLHPAHSENIYWISTISTTLSTLFILYAVISFFNFRNTTPLSFPRRRESMQTKTYWISAFAGITVHKMNYLICLILSILAFLTYELAVVIPLLFILIDLYLKKLKKNLSSILIHLSFIFLLPLYFTVRSLTHAFSGGGDYLYNISNLIPNIFGNIAGYIGLFFAGERFLPIYNILRADFRENKLLFAMIFIPLLSIIIFIIAKYKKEIIKSLKSEKIKIINFGFIFGLISLLPYLALGNIAPRYIYLASVGFTISFALILSIMSYKITSRLKYLVIPAQAGIYINKYWIRAFTGMMVRKVALLLFLSLSIAILIIFRYLIIAENNQWKKAGIITKNMLAEFRINYENLSSGSDIYFVNVPMKQDNAWVFPVGLADSLWFIYRENTPHIYQTNTVDEARIKIKNQKSKENYIFQFDSHGNIQRIAQ